jgi:hypothetical protein
MELVSPREYGEGGWGGVRGQREAGEMWDADYGRSRAALATTLGTA